MISAQHTYSLMNSSETPRHVLAADYKKLELFFVDTYSFANSISCLPQLFINAVADSEWIGVSRLDPRRSAKQDRGSTCHCRVSN